MILRHQYIKAAEEDEMDDPMFDDMEFDDEEEDMSRDHSDEETEEEPEDEDEIEVDVEEDDIDIDMENNITDHYIAECERCHGVFITALSQTDQKVELISGVCPLCDHETDQYLKWIIREV